ncbi:nicotinamide/nicotinic acid mononucleotide adenylyltransferase 3-like [Oscarella lobularis]|uniref:nicotinamide/nicotinic acid mononucleotide adenylyltransferase 3-like n=1 Tax=Oscarella lobularis TaxID=121494 RepID=UPI0033134D48
MKRKVVLLACGSFNPITHMHLRMFETARDHLTKTKKCGVIHGGIISPVNDKYEKKGLVAGFHRVAMVKAAVGSSDWINVDSWEVEQPGWTVTRRVIEHFQETHDPSRQNLQFKLLCGADLLESFAVPNLWDEEDIEVILKDFGLVVMTRAGSNPQQFIDQSPQLTRLKDFIDIIDEPPHAISATLIREYLKSGKSVKYLIPDTVIDYIKQNQLYT